MMMTWMDWFLFPVGHFTGSAAEVAALLVRIVWVASYVWFVIAGFKTDWKWGTGNLLFPFVALAYFYLYPERGRRPGLLWVAGTLMFILTMVLFKQKGLEHPAGSI